MYYFVEEKSIGIYDWLWPYFCLQQHYFVSRGSATTVVVEAKQLGGVRVLLAPSTTARTESK